jgi:DNA N-6-adenine-methyltransferase (Dam)
VAYRKRNAKKRYAKPPCDDEWFTPKPIVKAARAVLKRIDLDPASHPHPQSWIKARVFYTKEQNALTETWLGNTWLNPPYSSGLLGRFVEKLLAELRAGNVSSAILLTPTARTNWYHTALAASDAICIARKIRFEKIDGLPRVPSPYDSTIFYYGNKVAAFRAAFEPLGAVMSPTRRGLRGRRAPSK